MAPLQKGGDLVKTMSSGCQDDVKGSGCTLRLYDVGPID